MAVAHVVATDEERAEQALIAAAGKLLSSDKRGVPEDFISALFAYAAPEDLMRYDARQLAGLAADSWSLLAVRKPGYWGERTLQWWVERAVAHADEHWRQLLGE